MRAVLIDSTKQRINKFHLGTAPSPNPPAVKSWLRSRLFPWRMEKELAPPTTCVRWRGEQGTTRP